MPSTLTITGPTFTNYVVKALPTIPSLQSLAFFGTGGDGINTNRAAGGPAFSVLSGAPVYGTNFVSVGLQGGAQAVISCNVPRTAGVLSSGWTWATVGRSTGATSNLTAVTIGDRNGTADNLSQGILMAATTGNKLYGYSGAFRTTLNTVKATSDWHFAAMSYSGGALGTMTVYDFTEDPAAGGPLTYVFTVTQTAGAQTPHFGATTGEVGANGADVAFGMVSTAVMTGPALATLATSVRSFLARRGITC